MSLSIMQFDACTVLGFEVRDVLHGRLCHLNADDKLQQSIRSHEDEQDIKIMALYFSASRTRNIVVAT